MAGKVWSVAYIRDGVRLSVDRADDEQDANELAHGWLGWAIAQGDGGQFAVDVCSTDYVTGKTVCTHVRAPAEARDG